MTDIITVFTDGSCLGNPGPGGYCALLRMNDTEKALVRGFKLTTNNRMELMAVIEALKALTRPCTVAVYTDSKYVRDAIEKKWLAGWQKKGWVTASKTPVKNQDLWRELIPLLKEHKVTFHWVQGHNGHPENEKCDRLAKAAASGPNKEVDAGFTN